MVHNFSGKNLVKINVHLKSKKKTNKHKDGLFMELEFRVK